MRNIDQRLQTKLDSGATTMCRCWLVVRRDGARFGFTDHDRDISFAGNDFSAHSGLDASVVEASTGLSVDNGQALGALTSDGLNEVDIMGGKFDGAEVHQWLVDWQEPDLNILLFRGSIGEVRRSKSSFEAELRGMSEQLNKPFGRAYLRECDRVLGDNKCGVDVNVATLSAKAEVFSMTAKGRFGFSGLGHFQDGWFANGTIQWLSGGNTGLVSLIKSDDASGAERILDVWEEARFDVSVGDMVRVVAGCDKRAQTCRVKFGNFTNFRGFPHMPGEDWVTAYPSPSGKNDGGSIIGNSNG